MTAPKPDYSTIVARGRGTLRLHEMVDASRDLKWRILAARRPDGLRLRLARLLRRYEALYEAMAAHGPVNAPWPEDLRAEDVRNDLLTTSASGPQVATTRRGAA